MKANKIPESRNLNVVANIEQGIEGKKYISGIIPYNSRSQFMRIGYSNCSYEMLAPTVFNKTIADHADIYVNYAHNDEHILGRLSAGTLEVNNTPEGLTFKMLVPNTPWGEEAYGTIESGNCRTISFEFIPYTWKEDEATDTVILTSAKLTAISLCVICPAYTETDTFASIRSMTDKLKKEKTTLTPEDIQQIVGLVEELKKLIPSNEPAEQRKDEEIKDENAESTEAKPEDKPEDKPQDSEKEAEEAKVEDEDKKEENSADEPKETEQQDEPEQPQPDTQEAPTIEEVNDGYAEKVAKLASLLDELENLMQQ